PCEATTTLGSSGESTRLLSTDGTTAAAVAVLPATHSTPALASMSHMQPRKRRLVRSMRLMGAWLMAACCAPRLAQQSTVPIIYEASHAKIQGACTCMSQARRQIALQRRTWPPIGPSSGTFQERPLTKTTIILLVVPPASRPARIRA
ncbi:hypothetical protein GGI10_005916, partial [Coemansia sp. RSA 2530]